MPGCKRSEGSCIDALEPLEVDEVVGAGLGKKIVEDVEVEKKKRRSRSRTSE